MPIDMPPSTVPAIHQSADATTTPAPWQPSEATIQQFEKDRPGFLFRENLMPAYQLPDVLNGPDGRRVGTAEEWDRTVRPALIDQFSRYVYGVAPAAPAGLKFEPVSEDAHALDGQATRRTIRVVVPVDGKTPFTFTFAVFTPNHATGKVSAFLLLNNRGVAAADPDRKKKSDFWPVETIISRGYATAVLHLPDVQADKPDGLSSGIVAALPGPAEPDERWATIAAWAWAANRVLDGLATVSQIDTTRVAVIGHSRGGKTALWAGATDPRFGMVISNCSGCGGAALSRRPFGETVAKINEVFPHWFAGRFKTFNDHPQDLPIDQHQLLATIAPRPLYVGCADEDLWADPKGEFIALSAASAVSALKGDPSLDPSELPAINQSLIRGHLGYHVRSGGHDLSKWDWEQYLAFADRFWKSR